MQAEELKELKSVLLAEQSRLEELLDRTSKHLYRREEPYNADFAEQAVEVENNQVVEALDVNAKTELHQIRAALGRMDEGQYGTCHECGNSISIQRLKAVPFTSVCVACA